MARIVVIGAGLSGLAAAARLARLRHEVIVCERGSGPGGAAGRHESDGFGFDTGPTLLNLPAAYRDLFVKTGKNAPLESVLELAPVEPAVCWRFADGTRIELPNASRAGAMDAITGAFSASAAAGWDRLIATGNEVWAEFRKGFLAEPVAPPPWWRRDRPQREALAALRPRGSFADLAKRHLEEPRLQQAAASYALRLGCDPAAAHPGLVLWPWMEQTFGTWQVIGGTHKLVDAIAARAALRGAQFRYDTEVIGIDVAAGKVAGVRLRGGQALAADLVVAAVDDEILNRLHPGAVPTPGPRSWSAACLLLALRGEPSGPVSTIDFPARAAPELESLRAGSPSADPTLFLTRAQAPAGATAYSVVVPAPRNAATEHRTGTDWNDPATADSYARALIAVLDARGYAVSPRLLRHKMLSPAELAERTGSPGGALIGPALHGRDALLRNPNTTGVTGLYHVGAAAHPGPGWALAPLSGALVAEALGRARPGR